ncbi:hypothetical protein AVEN_95678-1, partial [Araneus ventricosus]
QMFVEENLIDLQRKLERHGSRTTSKACHFSSNEQEDTGNE